MEKRKNRSHCWSRTIWGIMAHVQRREVEPWKPSGSLMGTNHSWCKGWSAFYLISPKCTPHAQWLFVHVFGCKAKSRRIWLSKKGSMHFKGHFSRSINYQTEGLYKNKACNYLPWVELTELEQDKMAPQKPERHWDEYTKSFKPNKNVNILMLRHICSHQYRTQKNK